MSCKGARRTNLLGAGAILGAGLHAGVDEVTDGLRTLLRHIDVPVDHTPLISFHPVQLMQALGLEEGISSFPTTGRPKIWRPAWQFPSPRAGGGGFCFQMYDSSGSPTRKRESPKCG